MGRWLTFLLFGLLVTSNIPATHAQEADTEYFASLEGLQRIVARSYMAPPAETVVTESPSEATSETRPSGTVLLSIFVYQFDVPDNAAASFDIFGNDLQNIMKRDLRAPTADDLQLEDMGDRAKGYIGNFGIEGTTLINTFATVQDGVYVYSLMGQFVNMDGVVQTQNSLKALIEADSHTGDGQYREDGTSTGGLWDKFALLNPDLTEGSTVTDLQIYPPPGEVASSETSSTMEIQTSDVHDLSQFEKASVAPMASSISLKALRRSKVASSASRAGYCLLTLMKRRRKPSIHCRIH